MDEILNKEISSERINIVRNNVIELLKKGNELNNYKEVIITKITDNIYAVSSETNNISFFVNNKGEVILNTLNITNSQNFIIYSKLLGIEETKKENGEYEMFKIDEDGKKTKINQFSIEYFEIWKKLGFLMLRDTILNTYEGNSKNTVFKIQDSHLETFINEGVIRLIDLTIFLSKGNLTYDQYNKYHLQVMNLLLEQIGDERFGLLPNNNEFPLNNKYGMFEINTGKVTKDEVNYLLSQKYISPEIHKLAIEKIEELEKLEAEKSEEVKKDFNDLKSEIRGR